MAHFVDNSGGFRGGAWEARAPLLFLDQTEAAPEGSKKFFWRPGPPYLRVWMTGCPPPYLKVWICHCIIIQLLLTCASKAFACLVVLVEGTFYEFSSLKIFDQLCASSADETEIYINYQTTQCKNGFPLFNTDILCFLLLSFFFYSFFLCVNVLCSCVWCAVPDPLI